MLQITVITPTYYRFKEIPGYFECLRNQSLRPKKVIIVDGAPNGEKRTENWINQNSHTLPFIVEYYRKIGGTAIQRNFGISKALDADLLAFVDDDVRLARDFLELIHSHFESDINARIGGITGVKRNQKFDMSSSIRWRIYRWLRLLRTYTPSAYDRACGYPINANAQPAFEGTRDVDIMTSACTVYRSEVFEDDLRFDNFFVDYGMLEDAHLALSVQLKGYVNLQCGDAYCQELSSPSGRSNGFTIGKKTCINYYFVFNSICGPLNYQQRIYFFRYQIVELLRFTISFIKHRNSYTFNMLIGKFVGIYLSLLRYQRTIGRHII